MKREDFSKLINKYDREGMLKLIESFPEQCADAREIGSSFRLPKNFPAQFDNVVCTGLGGSAIGADLARSYIADEALIPVFVNRNYLLPKFVNDRTLVITASYSGNTEETLSAYRDAKSKNAHIIAITSGGELKKLAQHDGFSCVIIPAGFPPRCALAYSFFPLLIVLSKAGVVKDKIKDIDDAIANLETLSAKLGSKSPLEKNIAKRIAQELYGRYALIYCSQDHIDSVATRWRGQLAENAKTISSTHVFPEMNHNEIVGWENPESLLKKFIVVLLKDKDDNPKISKRMDVTKRILQAQKAKVIEVRSEGRGLLSRIFSLVYTGDFVSFYLALLNGEDPTPVDRITYLKKELAKA